MKLLFCKLILKSRAIPQYGGERKGFHLWHQNAVLPNLNTVFDSNEESLLQGTRVLSDEETEAWSSKRFIQNQRHLLSLLFRPQNHHASNQKALKPNSFVSGKEKAERDLGARKSECCPCICLHVSPTKCCSTIRVKSDKSQRAQICACRGPCEPPARKALRTSSCSYLDGRGIQCPLCNPKSHESVGKVCKGCLRAGL